MEQSQLQVEAGHPTRAQQYHEADRLHGNLDTDPRFERSRIKATNNLHRTGRKYSCFNVRIRCRTAEEL